MRFILFLWLLAFQIGYSQNQDFSYFNKVYGADTMNILSMVCKPLPNGDYFVLGGYTSINQSHILYLRKIDSLGKSIWLKSIDSGENAAVIENGQEALISKDNHLVLTFYKQNSLNTDDFSIHLLKLDTEGNIVWKQVYHNGIINTVNHLIETHDNGFVIIGTEGTSSSEDGFCYVLRTDNLGNTIWKQTYQLDGHTLGLSIEQTHDNGFIFSGTGETTGMDYDMFVIKTDSLGNEEWRNTYGGEEQEGYSYVKLLTSKSEYEQAGKMEYLLIGEDKPIQSDDDLYIAKLDDRGTVIWEKRYDDFDDIKHPYPYFQTMPVLESDKGFKIMANYRGVNEQGVIVRIPVLMDFDSNGNVNWQKVMSMDIESKVHVRDLQATPDGGYIMAGFKSSPAPQQSWIVKVDADGNTCWVADCDSTVLITNIEEPSISPSSFSLSLFPNPASEQVEVVYQLPNNQSGILKVYDYQGRLIDNRVLDNGYSSLILDLEGFTAGVYLYSLEVEGERLESGKLVVE
ncbi:MAG: T9SS type A sorting domain-containing protein [Chitinophagales bacterium]